MGDWPTHGSLVMPWKSQGRPPREDREFTEVMVSVPPKIAECWFEPGRETIVALEEAAVAVASLDVTAGSRMAAISGFLLRSEALSSSKIEQVDANRNDYAKAMIGLRASDNAKSMVAAAEAVQMMITDAGTTGEIRMEAILAAHRALMKDDPVDAAYAGKIRDMQNWIGGSDYSPRGNIHVPPPPERVPGLMADLMAFCNRTDVPIMAQAAIAHAQFESIHPFTDGNGRIGRALIGAISRRRRLTRNTVTPIASAMVADVDRYFALVNNYRNVWLIRSSCTWPGVPSTHRKRQRSPSKPWTPCRPCGWSLPVPERTPRMRRSSRGCWNGPSSKRIAPHTSPASRRGPSTVPWSV